MRPNKDHCSIWVAVLASFLTSALLSRTAGADDAAAKPRSIAFLVIDGIFDTELVAPMDVLQHVDGRVEHAPRVFTVGLTKDPVRTAEGLSILPDYSIDDAPPIDVLVVASTIGSRGKDRQNEKLVSWIASTGERAQHVMSLCWGAFLLAQAGLLDGGPATTFPTTEDYDLMEKDYPRIQVKRNVSFVDAGHALTSAGGVKSYEVAMYLVENLYGKEVADGIASGLLIDWDSKKLSFVKAN
jgi:transcriptional regulator GlxA family with amidase domain